MKCTHFFTVLSSLWWITTSSHSECVRCVTKRSAEVTRSGPEFESEILILNFSVNKICWTNRSPPVLENRKVRRDPRASLFDLAFRTTAQSLQHCLPKCASFLKCQLLRVSSPEKKWFMKGLVERRSGGAMRTQRAAAGRLQIELLSFQRPSNSGCHRQSRISISSLKFKKLEPV